MIKYKLVCKNCETNFDSWFASSKEYEKLKKKNLLNCHFCNSRKVEKSLMAPKFIRSEGPYSLVLVMASLNYLHQMMIQKKLLLILLKVELLINLPCKLSKPLLPNMKLLGNEFNSVILVKTAIIFLIKPAI